MDLPRKKPSERLPKYVKGKLWMKIPKRIGGFIADKLLILPAGLFGLGMFLRNIAFNVGFLPTRKLPVRVISVGNLSSGGTGKTPVCEYLLGFYSEAGAYPAFLSRGYGRKSSGFRIVDLNTDTAERVGDEAMQVAMRYPGLPVAVSENRWKGGKQLLQQHPEITHLILDDGFQHRWVFRHLDILTMDANRPPWKDSLLPRGGLRELLSSSRRAHLIIVNKTNDQTEIRDFRSKLKRYRQGRLAFTRVRFDRVLPFNPEFGEIPLEDMRQRPVVVFSGLANNKQFQDSLSFLNVSVLRFFSFPDHYHFRERDLKKIIKRFNRFLRRDIYTQQPILLTSSKDATRIISQPWFQENYWDYPFYIAYIGLEFLRDQDSAEQILKSQIPTYAAH